MAGLAACTGGTGEPQSEPEGTFAVPAEEGVTCLEHQLEQPGAAYTGGTEGDTARIFALLKYWAANGDKAYCDGEPPTAVDTRWRDLVAELGATRPPDPPSGAGQSPSGDSSTPEATPEPTPSTPVPTPTGT